ncbi:hypothetical protein NESM_000506300 [Novymonas esmeraldas]|uniref:Transmembrane protein n=1 Tax=Novymonas esmeraldas TaxID=1808958 RepID=A0AAW0EQM5_9TRYP
MDAYMQALRLRVRDAAHSCWSASFPSDRPSGVYPVYTCVINGGLLVWSFSTVLSSTCETVAGRWVYTGMGHCFVNMIFCVAVMAVARQQIAAGIPGSTSQWRVCFSNPLIPSYALYLIWEVVWMIAVGQYSSRHPRTTCVSHLNVQVAFLVFYLLIGAALFYSAFITERCRRPRWRHFAAMRHDYLLSMEGGHARTRHSVRWNDEHTPAAGEAGEPLEMSRVGRARRQGTERTTVLDYASVMDDAASVVEVNEHVQDVTTRPPTRPSSGH